MLHKIDLNSVNAVGFRWEGKYDEKAFKQSVLQFLPELQSRAKMNVYLEVLELSDVEAKALWEEIKFDVKNYKQLLDKIDKIALATDEDWIKNLSKGFGLVPGISIKTFSLDEKDTAKLWVVK